jgi:hypothetical protein
MQYVSGTAAMCTRNGEEPFDVNAVRVQPDSAEKSALSAEPK